MASFRLFFLNRLLSKFLICDCLALFLPARSRSSTHEKTQMKAVFFGKMYRHSWYRQLSNLKKSVKSSDLLPTTVEEPVHGHTGP